MNNLLLTHNRLDVGAISELVGHNSCGAISLFVGITRDNFEGNKVLSLEYEAYEQMALKQFQNICDNIRLQWSDVTNIAIHHRLGQVLVGQASVVIAISSPHRQTALESVNFAINELKRNVPIWKKEIYGDDNWSWKENRECAWLTNENDKSTHNPVKKGRFDIINCSTEADFIPLNLVQIKAEEEEIKRRIERFVEKKRNDININNIMDFIDIANANLKNGTEDTCARTNSVMIKQEQSKCHLRVTRVENRDGPQTKTGYIQTLNKLIPGKIEHIRNKKTAKRKTSKDLILTGIEDRLSNIENHLHLSIDDRKSIYDRIKTIEKCILYLESVSPEYKCFLTEEFGIAPTTNKSQQVIINDNHCKPYYSIDELNSIIHQIRGS